MEKVFERYFSFAGMFLVRELNEEDPDFRAVGRLEYDNDATDGRVEIWKVPMDNGTQRYICTSPGAYFSSDEFDYEEFAIVENIHEAACPPCDSKYVFS